MQLSQDEPVPAMGEEIPVLSLEKEANRENMRFAEQPHLGHNVSLLTSLIGFIISNL